MPADMLEDGKTIQTLAQVEVQKYDVRFGVIHMPQSGGSVSGFDDFIVIGMPDK